MVGSSLGGNSIGFAEFREKYTEQTVLGVKSTVDEALIRIAEKSALNLISKFDLKNKGKGSVIFTLKARGKEFPVTNENINALQVGATAQVSGQLGNRRVKPGTIVITDSNVGVPQRVEDTNGDGVLFQTDGPAGPTYPLEVGTVEYNNAVVNFTFQFAITTDVEADYTHTDWQDFSPSITSTIVGGGGQRTFILLPDNADAYFDGIKDMTEVAWFARKSSASEEEGVLGLIVYYHGDDNLIQLPLVKGEISDFPFHNA